MKKILVLCAVFIVLIAASSASVGFWGLDSLGRLVTSKMVVAGGGLLANRMTLEQRTITPSDSEYSFYILNSPFDGVLPVLRLGTTDYPLSLATAIPSGNNIHATLRTAFGLSTSWLTTSIMGTTLSTPINIQATDAAEDSLLLHSEIEAKDATSPYAACGLTLYKPFAYGGATHTWDNANSNIKDPTFKEGYKASAGTTNFQIVNNGTDDYLQMKRIGGDAAYGGTYEIYYPFYNHATVPLTSIDIFFTLTTSATASNASTCGYVGLDVGDATQAFGSKSAGKIFLRVNPQPSAYFGAKGAGGVDTTSVAWSGTKSIWFHMGTGGLTLHIDGANVSIPYTVDGAYALSDAIYKVGATGFTAGTGNYQYSLSLYAVGAGTDTIDMRVSNLAILWR